MMILFSLHIPVKWSNRVMEERFKLNKHIEQLAFTYRTNVLEQIVVHSPNEQVLLFIPYMFFHILPLF